MKCKTASTPGFIHVELPDAPRNDNIRQVNKRGT